ncbi:tetratricopeptide repeat-like domain-containing protein [Ditylenchus destructor]|nr:tetratricopeptide repeat-like domain-containing protein [Ditylenchus destructor]
MRGAAHRAALIAHFEAHADKLDEDAKRRLHTNPPRIRGTKNPAMQEVVEAAPHLMDFPGGGQPGALQRGARHAGRRRPPGKPRQHAPGARHGLLQPDRFRWVTDHFGSAASRRRPWASPGRRAPAVLIDELGRGGPSSSPDAPRDPARRRGAAAGHAGAGGAARRRRRGADACGRRLVQVAVQEGGFAGGPLGAGVGPPRAGARRGRGQAASRRRRASESVASRGGNLGGRSAHRIIAASPERPRGRRRLDPLTDGPFHAHGVSSRSRRGKEQLEQLKGVLEALGQCDHLAADAGAAVLRRLDRWNYWQRNQAAKAGAMFSELERAAQAGDVAKGTTIFNAMKSDFGSTGYTAQGALMAAKLQLDKGKGDEARATLTWAADNAKGGAYRDLARLPPVGAADGVQAVRRSRQDAGCGQERRLRSAGRRPPRRSGPVAEQARRGPHAVQEGLRRHGQAAGLPPPARGQAGHAGRGPGAF